MLTALLQLNYNGIHLVSFFSLNLMTVVFALSIDCIHRGVGVPIPVYGQPERHYEKSRRSSGQQSIHIRSNNGHCCLLFQTDFRLFTGLRRSPGMYSTCMFRFCSIWLEILDHSFWFISSDTVWTQLKSLLLSFEWNQFSNCISVSIFQQITREVSVWLAINLCTIIYVFIIMVFIYDLLVGHETTVQFYHTLILEAFLFIVNGKALFFSR